MGGASARCVPSSPQGAGHALAIHDTDSPPSFELLPQFNFSPSEVVPVLHTMHWAATEEHWQLPSHMADELAKTYKSEREENRARRKREGILDFIRVRERFFSGNFDSCVALWDAPLHQPHRLVRLRALLDHPPAHAIPCGVRKHCDTQPEPPGPLAPESSLTFSRLLRRRRSSKRTRASSTCLSRSRGCEDTRCCLRARTLKCRPLRAEATSCTPFASLIPLTND